MWNSMKFRLIKLILIGLLLGSVMAQEEAITSGLEKDDSKDLKPGDMLLYSGCDLEHWRDAFAGKDCGQVFLHYNDRTKKTAKENLYDKRPFLGLPAWFKSFRLPPTKK